MTDTAACRPIRRWRWPTSHSRRPPRALPATLRAVPSLGEPVAHKTVEFGEEMDMNAMMKGAAHGRPAGMRFTINGDTYAPHRATLTSRRGDVERWTIRNGTDMDHPFHLHGTQFQVIERESGGSRTSSRSVHGAIR